MADTPFMLSGYLNTGKVQNPFFRTWDLSKDPEAQNKVIDLFLWLKEKNKLEECGIPEAFIPSPIWSKYTEPSIRVINNIEVDPLENGNLDSPRVEENTRNVKRSTSSGNTPHKGRGRPKGSKNGNPSTVKAYIPTGRKRGRPPGAKNRPK